MAILFFILNTYANSSLYTLMHYVCSISGFSFLHTRDHSLMWSLICVGLLYLESLIIFPIYINKGSIIGRICQTYQIISDLKCHATLLANYDSIIYHRKLYNTWTIFVVSKYQNTRFRSFKKGIRAISNFFYPQIVIEWKAINCCQY